jgi:hypothetical protein
MFCLVLIITGVCEKPALLASAPISGETPLTPNNVQLGPNNVEIPYGKIMLIRKNNIYGALKFNTYWVGQNKDDNYATYDCWYQDDSSSDFSNNKAILKKGKVSNTRLYGIGRFAFNFGNPEICCGDFRLFWSGKSQVYFYGREQRGGDYGIELSPTKWTDIKEVNVFDPNLKWYRYDNNRPQTDIPVDKLW